MHEIDVVIIDDNAGILWLIKEILSVKSISHKVTQIGSEGIELIDKYKPSVAVVDLKLGAMTGLDVAKEIHKKSKKTKILFITGYSNAISKEVTKELPVAGVLEKPFDIEKLISTIVELVKEKHGDGSFAS